VGIATLFPDYPHVGINSFVWYHSHVGYNALYGSKEVPWIRDGREAVCKDDARGTVGGSEERGDEAMGGC